MPGGQGSHSGPVVPGGETRCSQAGTFQKAGEAYLFNKSLLLEASSHFLCPGSPGEGRTKQSPVLSPTCLLPASSLRKVPGSAWRATDPPRRSL